MTCSQLRDKQWMNGPGRDQQGFSDNCLSRCFLRRVTFVETQILAHALRLLAWVFHDYVHNKQVLICKLIDQWETNPVIQNSSTEFGFLPMELVFSVSGVECSLDGANNVDHQQRRDWTERLLSLFPHCGRVSVALLVCFNALTHQTMWVINVL